MGVICKNLRKSFGKDTVLDNVSFEFPSKGFIGIYGASGAGKSTLLNIIGGLLKPDGGTISVDGIDLVGMTEERSSMYRLTKVGFLRQNAEHLEFDSVGDNAVFPLKAISALSSSHIKKKQEDLLSLVGLLDKKKQAARRLSGGERQRLALARSLSTDPDILLCDEPTGALDEENAESVFSILKAISKKSLVISVSHDEARLRKFSDSLYRLMDGKLEEMKNRPTVIKSKEILPSRLKERKPKARMPISSWLLHGWNILKERKKRTLFAISSISFSLVALVSALYLKDSLSDRVSQAFGTVMGPPSIVVEKKNPDEPTFGRVIAASEEDVLSLADSNPETIASTGVTYLADFDAYFPDRDEAYIPYKNKKIAIPSLGIRNAADFLTLDHIEEKVYPEIPSVLENDQIILGVPYSSMVSICFGLSIMRDFDHLGEYIENNELTLVFSLENQSWSYADEQIVSIVGVTKTEVPTIFHSDPYWSTYLLEFKMRFPTNDEPDSSLPWIMVKVNYVVPKRKDEFIESIKTEDGLRKYLFDPVSSDYEATHCPIDGKCSLERYYVYLGDERRLDDGFIDSLEDIPKVKGYFTCAENSYYNFPSAFMSGFARPFYAADSEDKIDYAIDAVGYIETEKKDFSPDLGENILQGSYLLPAASSLSFSSAYGEWISGKEPVGLEEIALSDEAYKALGSPETLYIGATVGEKEVGAYTSRDIRKTSLKVSGVYESDFMTLGHDPRWTEDFFVHVLGSSVFSNRPVKAVLEIEGNDEFLLEEMAVAYPNYRWSLPSKTVSDSLKDVSSLLSKCLLALSSIGIVLSFLLLFVTSILETKEGEKEAVLLGEMGFSPGEILKGRIIKQFLLVGLSLLISTGLSLAFQIVLGYMVDTSFGVTASFSIEPAILIPLLPMFVISLAFVATLETLALSRRMKKKDNKA